MKRKLFTDYPQIPGDVPMEDTVFYHWMTQQARRSIDRFVDTLKLYLGQYGFDIEKHTIAGEQIKAHRHVFDMRWFRFCHHLKP